MITIKKEDILMKYTISSKLLSCIVTALDDAMVLCGTELCDKETIRSTSKRICNNGGTLIYFAKLKMEIKKIKGTENG